MKQITTGTENFKEFIDKDYYYVDKSSFIESVFLDKVSLFVRPRRFGKTLNMSMLYYFFSNKEKDNAYLFDKLEISKNKDILKHQNQYPVIYMTLKDMKNNTFESFIENYRMFISHAFYKFKELEKSQKLDNFEKDIFQNIKEMKSNETILKGALLYLSQMLEKHYGKKVIILIDEYDVPLQSAYQYGYYDEMTNFMSSVFSSVLKTNESLERGILTGCLRIAKESIFTGLNNFSVYSILDEDGSHDFGFTQNEIDELLSYYQIKEYREKIKEWYDGYLFGNIEIYNPWSTLKYTRKLLNSTNKMAESFWANTSGNDIVYNYIKQADQEMKDDFEKLVQGQAITKAIYPELTYREMDDIDNIYSFLLFTGYLKIKDYAYDQDNHVLLDTYQLVIPNKEVYKIYEQNFIKYFREYTKDRKEIFVDALIKEDIEQANIVLNDILERSVSFMDNYESFYHGFMVGLLSNYNTHSNRESGAGKYDIGVFPRNLFKPCIVIELKKSKTSTGLIKTADEAIEQIEKKKYIEGVKNDGYMNVLAYGISFYEKTCYIKKA